MEPWIPLFDIFMNDPTPETQASLWLQQSFLAASSGTATKPITTSSFLSLLMEPREAIVDSPSSSSPVMRRRVMFLQTLPNLVQSRILSFLFHDREKFSRRELSRLSLNVLRGNVGLDFWVETAARNLFDALSETIHEWNSSLTIDSGEDTVGEEFDSLPEWLKGAATANDPLFPWLPLHASELVSESSVDACGNEDYCLDLVGEDGEIEQGSKERANDMEIDYPVAGPLQPQIQEIAVSLGEKVLCFESTSKTIALANEIRQLCLDKGANSFEVLSLIKPWQADDETVSVLMSHLSRGEVETLSWASQVLCSVLLPKFLVLEEPASRLLLTATVEYCKLHQKAAVHGFFQPLVLRKGGINHPICEVLTRIIRECLHPAHVSALCQMLLCGDEMKRFILLPCHQYLISNELVWTESLFNLFHNILNHNVHLTQDSIDHLVYRVREFAETFSRSLKFGNFLLCLVNKCSPLLKSHKFLLIGAVECTNTLVTKSLLSKLACL